jgi:hypothetical protein
VAKPGTKNLSIAAGEKGEKGTERYVPLSLF